MPHFNLSNKKLNEFLNIFENIPLPPRWRKYGISIERVPSRLPKNVKSVVYILPDALLKRIDQHGTGAWRIVYAELPSLIKSLKENNIHCVFLSNQTHISSIKSIQQCEAIFERTAGKVEHFVDFCGCLNDSYIHCATSGNKVWQDEFCLPSPSLINRSKSLMFPLDPPHRSCFLSLNSQLNASVKIYEEILKKNTGMDVFFLENVLFKEENQLKFLAHMGVTQEKTI